MKTGKRMSGDLCMQSSIWAAGIQLAIAEHVSDKRPRSAALLAGTIHILRRLLDWYLENKRVPEDLFFFSPKDECSPRRRSVAVMMQLGRAYSRNKCQDQPATVHFLEDTVPIVERFRGSTTWDHLITRPSR